MFVDAAAAVADAGGEYAVDPALEDGGHGHAEPVDWKVGKDEVGAAPLFQRSGDVRGEGAGGDDVALFHRLDQVVGVGMLAEAGGAGDGVEAHGIEVGNDHLVAGGGEGGDGEALHRGVEGLRFVVAVDLGQLHQPFLLGETVLVARRTATMT